MIKRRTINYKYWRNWIKREAKIDTIQEEYKNHYKSHMHLKMITKKINKYIVREIDYLNQESKRNKVFISSSIKRTWCKDSG
jgi:RNase P subunit RPR2